MLLVIFSLLCCVKLYVMQDAHIDGCSSDGLIRVVENQSFHTYCGAFGPYREATFYWQIQPWRQNETLKVVCSSDAYLCPSPGVRVHVHVPEISSLTIDMVERAMFNSSTLTCNVTFRDRPDWSTNDSCLIEVTYPADIGACQLQVHKENWTVVGSCDVTKVFSSSAKYGCTMEQSYNTIDGDQISRHVTNITSLTSFTETSSGLVYYRGQCQSTFPLPSSSGNLTYSVLVTPGSSRKSINQTLLIVPPSAPLLIGCGQEFLAEGGNYHEPPCVCQVKSLGSPAGRLVWRSGDAVMVSGDYGDTWLRFPYEKMNRTHSGQTMMCQVDWVNKRNSTSFTANIAYGPDRAAIFVQSDENSGEDDDNVTLLCTSLHVHPVSALLTVWGGLCQGQQGRTCTLTNRLHELDGKNVTCTLTNQKVPGKQATVTWTQKLDSDTTQPNCANSSLSEGVGLGIGIMLVVVLVVVAVLLVLLWRRRLLPVCPCYSPTYASTSKRQQEGDEASHTYTDLSYYEPVRAASPPRQQVNADRRTAGASDNTHVYANTAADIQA